MVNQIRKNKKLGSLICFILVLSVFMPVISIAFARKPDRGPLEKIVFIHHRKDYVRPPWLPDKDKNGEEGHYTFLARGVKWPDDKLPIKYVINPTLESDNNPNGLPLDFITGAISISAEEWDDGAYTNNDTIWDGVTVNLFDDTYTLDHSASWDTETPDYQNELVFGDYPQDGVIAVCIVWGYFTGPPSTRKIVEFDILFDTDFTWGNATIDPTVMDLQNIATHELGHGLGLGDLYDTAASKETMYGYSWNGDIEKRDLYIGDIAGIRELYE